jgi:hypothetical protein
LLDCLQPEAPVHPERLSHKEGTPESLRGQQNPYRLRAGEDEWHLHPASQYFHKCEAEMSLSFVQRTALVSARDYLLWLVELKGIKAGAVESVRSLIDKAIAEDDASRKCELVTGRKDA